MINTQQDLSAVTPPVTTPLLQVEDLSVVFRRSRRATPVHAVDGVSLSIAPGETLGLVGESGSGKTTLGQAVLGMVRPTSGSVRFAGQDITRADAGARRRLSSDLQVIFQNPYGSLSPTRTIGQTLEEPLRSHGRSGRRDARDRAQQMLTRVGLPADALNRYPSEFSGGQRQRIAIARALMLSPRLVICDEPVSALDLSVQAQVLNLLTNLQEELSLGYLFVAHNLAVVRHMSHRIVVLYRGRIMETGPADRIYDAPAHPYTRYLLAAVPVADPDAQAVRRAGRGSTPAAPPPPTGGDRCPFVTRCPYVIDACSTVRPPMVTTPSGTSAACIRIGDLPPMETGEPVTPPDFAALSTAANVFPPAEG